MPLGYNPKEEEDSEREDLKGGTYEFKVDAAQEVFFKTGNEGLKVKLLVGYERRDVPCFVNLAYTKKALWRLRQFMECIGADFDNPPELSELEGLTGHAVFGVNDRGYFEVEDWIPAGGQVTAPVKAHENNADDVPF